ncbi:unnamed protein product [Amaranthus hypochondriacus]
MMFSFVMMFWSIFLVCCLIEGSGAFELLMGMHCAAACSSNLLATASALLRQLGAELLVHCPLDAAVMHWRLLSSKLLPGPLQLWFQLLAISLLRGSCWA